MPNPPEPPQSTSVGPPKALGGGSDERRLFAALAYALPVLGGLMGLAVDRSNPLTRHHAQQSIAAVLTLALSFVTWVVGGFVIGLIPSVGPIVALALFSLVIATAIFLALNWLVSLVAAARGQQRTIPFANRLAARLFGAEDKAKTIETSA